MFKFSLFKNKDSHKDWINNKLTINGIIEAFCVILGRYPSGEEIKEKIATIKDSNHLRIQLLWSQEFQEKNPEFSLNYKENLLIKEIKDDLRMYVDLSDKAISHSIINDNYELDETKYLKNTLKENQVALDLGGNIGYYSILMRHIVGEKGMIFAFEPIEKFANMIKMSANENGFKNIYVYTACVGSKDSPKNVIQVDFNLTPNRGGTHLVEKNASIPIYHERKEVEVITIDEMFQDKKIDFIKMDVEGAEPFVIDGAINLLKKHHPTILSEVHREQLQKVSKCTSKEFIKKLENIGYKCYRLKSGKLAQCIHETRSDIENVVFSA